MNEIKPGTPCYLVNLREMASLTGRVVAVVAGPLVAPEQDVGSYRITAAWAREMFGDSDVTAPRSSLLPIVPPGIAPPAAKKRVPETI